MLPWLPAETTATDAISTMMSGGQRGKTHRGFAKTKSGICANYNQLQSKPGNKIHYICRHLEEVEEMS